MNDKNNNTKTPEYSRGAPTSATFFAAFPSSPSDLPRPSTMPPRTLRDTPFYRTVDNPYSFHSFEDSSREQTPYYRTADNPYSFHSFEDSSREQTPYYRTADNSYSFHSFEDNSREQTPSYRTADNPYNPFREEVSREQAPVYNTSSTRGSFLDLALSSGVRMNDSTLPSSITPYTEASRAARPTTPAESKKHKSMIVHEDEERAAELRELRDLYNLDLMSREEPEKKRSPNLMSTDESDSDYLYPDTESEPESEFFEEQERNSSPIPDCTDDESDDDYTAPDSDSDSESESGTEAEAEPSQEQGNEMSLSIGQELRSVSPPGFAWFRPHIPSWNDLGPRDDDMLYNDLFDLVPAPPLSPYMPPTAPCTPTPPQEQEQIRSSSPIDDDSLTTLGKALGKASRSLDVGSLDTMSQAFEKALGKHQPEDLEDLSSAKPSLSQDLEKKMVTRIGAYDLNIEKLGKEVRDHCDRIRERCDRLEREKRDRDNAGPPTFQELVDAVFPGPGIPLHEREKVKLERCSRLAERYQERFGISGNATAGPSQEQEKKTSLNSKLDEMIRQEREKLHELKADREVNRARCLADVSAWLFSPGARPRLPSPKPNNAVGMSLKEAGREIDALLTEHRAEEEKDALPDYETDMELGDDLLEGQESLPASPSSSQGQKRKRSASFHERSFFENLEKMRKHVRESVEHERKRRKARDQSFQGCMNKLYPADSEIWKIGDEPIQVRSPKPKESRSDEDLGNGDRTSSREYLWDEKELRGSEDSIDGLSTRGLPDMPAFVGMSPFAGMPPMPTLPPFPTMPALPNDSLSNIGLKKYPITRPASLTLPQSMQFYHAVSLTASCDHRPWRPETEILEAVSDKPFSEWADITGVREFIHDELSRFGCSKVTVEACRVTGEENFRLMVFMPKRVHQWNLSLSRYRISNRLSLWGITDVKVEIWETDFHLQVI
ncbi:uncharacterized protein FIESC28_07274 [Fusarium coffeatum]|uniref:Uncharacterized protein n=1 Tax=Fusarium coffeatum TaxID=231269 RepID=A0A366REQ9_9HYPO|nr:uncharacterized protein FIESC28_07274 [Fusarium coffeatum]RBR15633.1 hypothetical protein FIESC28_07274 [Fusarium coffeatum]